MTPDASAAPSPATVKERREIAAIRAYRLPHDGRELRVVRGEFHRHTEISGDGGNDGPLEDMWRYGIDVAGMDWLGNGDHDNGNGREYTWWLIQKTTDAFRIAGVFEPPFTYERSVAFPEGHRNVVFATRGIRTLPRLPKTDRSPVVHAPDTLMLFDYLKAFNGVCASHTSTTTMGTDWRDWGGPFEPMVEIYQGARQNYERPGAPRSPTANDAVGGWEPSGFINLALQRGYRFSFQSSSDHGSTHISYAMVLAEDNSREALLAAMRRRHTYAATDNIIAEFTCTTGGRTHLMGDEFTTATPPTLHVRLIGTERFRKVTLVKDDVEIVLGEPGRGARDHELGHEIRNQHRRRGGRELDNGAIGCSGRRGRCAVGEQTQPPGRNLRIGIEPERQPVAFEHREAWMVGRHDHPHLETERREEVDTCRQRLGGRQHHLRGVDRGHLHAPRLRVLRRGERGRAPTRRRPPPPARRGAPCNRASEGRSGRR